MELKAPFCISARLLPALKVGDTWISIRLEGLDDEGRLIYHYYIDSPDFCYENCDLKSGVGNGSLLEGFKCLLSFLLADSEHYRYFLGRESEDTEGFSFDSVSLNEWCYQNDMELQMLSIELEEGTDLITE